MFISDLDILAITDYEAILGQVEDMQLLTDQTRELNRGKLVLLLVDRHWHDGLPETFLAERVPTVEYLGEILLGELGTTNGADVQIAFEQVFELGKVWFAKG